VLVLSLCIFLAYLLETGTKTMRVSDVGMPSVHREIKAGHIPWTWHAARVGRRWIHNQCNGNIRKIEIILET